MHKPVYRSRAGWHRLVGLFFLAGLFLARPGMALDPERRVSQLSQDSWRTDEGLPQNSLLSMAQTRDGYVWLGTWEGLVRFDGARFLVFDKRNTPELRNHTIKALAEDAAGTLWVGTENGLVAYRGGRFERAQGPAAPLDGPKVERLLVSEGVLWVGTTVGLWQVPLVGGGATRQYTVENGLPDSHVLSLTHGEGGALWVGTSKGLARVVDGEVEASPFAIPGPRARPEVLALSRDSSGLLWLGTPGGLISWNGTIAQRYTVDEGLPVTHVSALYTDTQGTLWVGTRRGGLVRHTAEGFSPPVPGTGLTEAEVLSMLEDRDGHLWVGTYSGLFRLRDGPFSTYGLPEGLGQEGTVSTVLEDRHGTMWVGTVGAGLYRLENGFFRPVSADEGLPEKVIPVMHEAPDGTLWVGTGGGVYRYDGTRFTRLSREQGGPQGVVTALLVDSRGGVWIGTQPALMHLHGGVTTVYGLKQGVTQPVIVMAEDRDGRVWFGSETGLFRWQEDKKGLRRFTQKDGLPGDLVLALLADADGTVWVGTETGLGRWRDETWARFTVQQGLYDDAVFSLVPDGDGHLWMSSNKGVSRVSRRELEAVALGERERVASLGFDQRDGMRSAECNGNTQPSGWRAKDGRLWFTNFSGAIVVDPVRVRASREPPEVRIEEVRVQGQPVPVEDRVELPPGGSRLEIRFTAFTPVDAARLPFRYQLEGHDDGWVNTEVRMATYTGLRPGTYRFQVQAQARDGSWSPPVSLDVVLEPKLWQRTGVWLLFVLGLGLLGVSAYLLRVGQLKARERWLAERVQDRTRALARANEELESHMRTLRQTQAQLVQAGRMAAVGQLAAGVGHEINNPLAYIVSNLEHASEEAELLARELSDVRGAGPRLREVSQALREALHGADRVRRIVRDLKTFSRPDDEKQGPVELHAVLDSAVKIAMAELRPRAKLVRDYGEVPRVEGNEARLAQVFLNLLINAAQALPEGRAEENEVRLVTRVAPDGMVVAEVRDTGIGIAPESLARIFDPFYTTKPLGVGTGLGLSLCHAYVTAMGGSISVESEPGRGAVFRVRLRRATRESGAMPALPAQDRRGARDAGAAPTAQTQGGAREPRTVPTAQEWGTAAREPRPLPSQPQGLAREFPLPGQVAWEPGSTRVSRSTPAVQERGTGRDSLSMPALPAQERGTARDSLSMPALPTPERNTSRESRSTPAVQPQGAARASMPTAAMPVNERGVSVPPGANTAREPGMAASYGEAVTPDVTSRARLDAAQFDMAVTSVPASTDGRMAARDLEGTFIPAGDAEVRVAQRVPEGTFIPPGGAAGQAAARGPDGTFIPPSSTSAQAASLDPAFTPASASRTDSLAASKGPAAMAAQASAPAQDVEVTSTPASGTVSGTAPRSQETGPSASGVAAWTPGAPGTVSTADALASGRTSYTSYTMAARAPEPEPRAPAREPRKASMPPESGPEASAQARGESTVPVRGRVLVVDDDALVSGAIRRTLSRENDVEVLVSARQALVQLTAPELRYDVVLCDLMMPEMTGMDLFDALLKAAPKVAGRVVFITGGAFTPAARTFLDRVENPRVEKPFDPESLRKLIRAEVARVRREASERAA